VYYKDHKDFIDYTVIVNMDYFIVRSFDFAKKSKDFDFNMGYIVDKDLIINMDFDWQIGYFMNKDRSVDKFVTITNRNIVAKYFISMNYTADKDIIIHKGWTVVEMIATIKIIIWRKKHLAIIFHPH